jgi:NAD(P)-dependent dehydrogenase (short-subunit alcohol dehydrogenase family)
MEARGRLAGRHALLTGAGGGIGLAVTTAFLAEGAHCTAVDLAAEPSAALAALIGRHGDRLAYAAADVTRIAALAGLVGGAAQRFGTVDLLFNNAAVFDMAPLLESGEAMYERLFDVNVKGMFFVMQAVLARLVAAGRRGSIINLASQAGRRGEALVAHYCASKAAVISYTQSAALAMAPHGIRVNAIAPGMILTNFSRHNFVDEKGDVIPEKLEQYHKNAGRMSPLGRAGEAEDVARAFLYLVSDAATFITGQIERPNGGVSMPW